MDSKPYPVWKRQPHCHQSSQSSQCTKYNRGENWDLFEIRWKIAEQAQYYKLESGLHFIIQLHPEPNKIFQDLNDGQRVKFELFSRVHFLNFERQSQDLLFAMNAYGFCQPYLSSLQTNKHLNRSANKSNSDDSKAVINYVSNYEPNLLNWYREFLESTNPRPKWPLKNPASDTWPKP